MVLDLDKLYTISDMHIGGPPGHQAFRETDGLVWLIAQVLNDPAVRVGLLLNGDIVDFLADGVAAEEFTVTPERFLKAVAGDSEFQKIFHALSLLLVNPNRFLICQIGNHDIELALPSAKRELLNLVGASSQGREKQVLFETSPRGWTCKVAGRLVLAMHGNAYDPWNEVDHAGLEAAASAMETGQSPIPRPATNAGTTLVIQVMNAIKQDYPFVDLFKPEDAPLMAVLQAVNARSSVKGVLRALGKRVRKGRLGELLRVEDGGEATNATGPSNDMLEFLRGIEVPRSDGRERMRLAEQRLHDGVQPRALAEGDDEQLGYVVDSGRVQLQRLESAVESLLGEPEGGALRRALDRWLARDGSFDIHACSDIDQRIIRSTSLGIDVVLAGHTHMPRELKHGKLDYLNTGTWMRVLKLQGSKFLKSDDEFRGFMDAIRGKTLDALDKLNIDPRMRPVAIVDRHSVSLQSVEEIPEGFRLTPIGNGVRA